MSDIKSMVIGPQEYHNDSHLLYLGAGPTQPNGMGLFASGSTAIFTPQLLADMLLAIERVLVCFAEDGSLSFTEACRVASIGGQLSTGGTGRGLETPGSWTEPAAIEAALMKNIAVCGAQVNRSSNGQLVSEVRTCTAGLDPSDLRRSLLAMVDSRHPVVVPDHFDIVPCPGGHTISTQERVTTAAEEALRRAVEAACGLPAVMDNSYVGGGGTLSQVPRVLRHLRANGFTGLRLDHFQLPCDLTHLARYLRPIECPG